MTPTVFFNGDDYLVGDSDNPDNTTVLFKTKSVDDAHDVAFLVSKVYDRALDEMTQSVRSMRRDMEVNMTAPFLRNKLKVVDLRGPE